MQIAEVMTRDVEIANPDQNIMDAARMMADGDYGSIPVGENDRLVGMVTDRDIVIRALARGMGGETKIRDVMSDDVKYCFEDDDVDDVARNMGDLQVRRLPVLNRDKRLIGMVSLGDITYTGGDTESAAEALFAISEPASLHTSTGQRPH